MASLQYEEEMLEDLQQKVTCLSVLGFFEYGSCEGQSLVQYRILIIVVIRHNVNTAWKKSATGTHMI